MYLDKLWKCGLNMKNTFKITTALFICLLVFNTSAFAASTRTTITVSENQTWVSKSDTRTGNYSDVYSRLYSVYPVSGGEDNFTRIQVKVTSSSGTSMSDIITLYETANANTRITLKNGTMGNKSVKFQFRGNNPKYAAKADLSYDAR